MSKFRLGICQTHVSTDKKLNLITAEEFIRKAYQKGADIIILPEMFNSPYNTKMFPKNAELIPDIIAEVSSKLHPTTYMLSKVAKELSIYLIGGSFCERGKDNRLYNTSLIIGPNGDIIGKHRKLHLFDINVKDKLTFKESDTLSSGSTITCVDTKWCTLGIAICYDLRFPLLAQIMSDRGAMLLIYVGAFNHITGPLHWSLLQRARAIDNQVFVASAAPALNKDLSYHSWGHSMVVDPWGKVISEAEFDPLILVVDIDLSVVSNIRESIPIRVQRREDLYSLTSIDSK